MANGLGKIVFTAFMETPMKYYTDNKAWIPNYNLCRSDRGRTCCGVGSYVNDSLQTTEL